MSHFVGLRRNRSTKAVSSLLCNGMRGEQRKAWNLCGFNICQSAHRGMDPIREPDDQALATLLRRIMIAQPPPEVWERIKENAGQMRLTQLTR